VQKYFLILLLVAVCSLAATRGAAQTGPDDDATRADAAQPVPNEKGEERKDWKLERGAKEIGFEFGFAPMQPTFFSGRKEYDTAGRKWAMGSFRWGRVIGTKKGVTYQYFFDIIPVAMAIKNEVEGIDANSKTDANVMTTTVRRNTYAFGVQPAGFRFIFRPSRRLKPYVQLGAGFVFSKKPIPIPGSPNYNFAGDFGGGFMYSLSKRKTVNFGYRYFHISNMNIGEINPGYNANLFYIGYSFFYK
jgi:opacity protein-like surface antigen